MKSSQEVKFSANTKIPLGEIKIIYDDGWRPIETAPHCVESTTGDRGIRSVLVTRIPATTNPPIHIARLRLKHGWKMQGGGALGYAPTHWMPLPEPPE